MEAHDPEECAAAGRALAIAVALATLKAIGDGAREMSRRQATANAKTEDHDGDRNDPDHLVDEVHDN